MRASLDDAPTSEIFEAIASLGAGVMAICGLVGIYAPIMAAAATIVFGAALAADGARILRDYHRTVASRVRISSGPLRFSVLAAGLVGASLAIFALFGADPAFLTPLASVVFGAGVVLKSNVAWELSVFRLVGATNGVGRGDLENGNDAAALALSGFISGALGAISMAGSRNDLTLNLIALVVAAFTMALWSRIAVAAIARLARPISLNVHTVISRRQGQR